MKKFFIATTAFFALSLTVILTTGCNTENACDADSNNVISTQVADSLSMSLGAFTGARYNWWSETTGDLTSEQKAQMEAEMRDFIEGFQLVVGNKYSDSKLYGIYVALNAMNEIEGAEQTAGININRSLYLKEFRKYVQQQNLTPDDISNLYLREQSIRSSIEKILEKQGAEGLEIDTTYVDDENMQIDVDYVVDNDSLEIMMSSSADDVNADLMSTEAL